VWGLDILDANSAIAAMNAMNISVRNGVFMPAFFSMPVVSLITALVAFLLKQRKFAALSGFAGFIYIAGAFIPTANINVPMNIALEVYLEPLSIEEADAIWAEYSPRWQFWNTFRTIVVGVSFLLVGLALTTLPRRS